MHRIFPEITRHVQHLKNSHRNITWVFISIIGISILGWFTNSVAPDSNAAVAAFFVIIGGSVFFLLLYLLNNVRRVAFLTIGLLVFLLLRLLGLREPLYILLFLGLLLSLELLFQKH